jgi:hypothetical protein
MRVPRRKAGLTGTTGRLSTARPGKSNDQRKPSGCFPPPAPFPQSILLTNAVAATGRTSAGRSGRSDRLNGE